MSVEKKFVGPKGAQLSGEQKQRIGLGRAFLSDAPIMFLDEATSALDQQTEDKVQRAMHRLSEGRTTIEVAHRLSTVMSANHIYVLEQGQLVEEGIHQGLMAAKRLYETLVEALRSDFGKSAA